MKNKVNKKKITVLPGFTLIELLIVIVIIGILAGVLLTVIDPAKQQRKARETVLRSTVEKGCLALHACGSTSSYAIGCDSAPEVGIINPDGTPGTATYTLTNVSGGNTNVVPGVNYTTMYFVGTYDTCEFQCGYTFAATGGTALPIGTYPGTVCLIGAQ
jgi:prepilin-type N-terminal cleavage/methylation domain-containing protein